MKKIGLVVAMVSEQKELFDKLGVVVGEYVFGHIKVTEFKLGDAEIFMADSGIGEISASLATQLLIVKYGVAIIINFGVVGSLSDSYKCKDIVLVKEVVHYDFSLQSSDPNSFGKYPMQRQDFVFKLNNKLMQFTKSIIGEFPEVRIATGDKFIDVTATRDWLINHFACEICDMESMGIYLACENFDVPCIMLKVVSDNADESAQDSFESIIESGVTFYTDAVVKLISQLGDFIC